MKRAVLIMAISCCVGSCGAAPKQAVMVGGEAELDACSSLGELKIEGALLHAYPATRAPGQPLKKGTRVIICDQAEGDWLGVLFDSRKPDGFGNCGVSSPLTPRQQYSGSCQAGWLKRDWLEVLI